MIFWRTSQSGGRATFRSRKGKKTTAAHCGDITAIEEEGLPLTELITIEIKRGYNKATINDIIDKPKRGAEQVLEAMLNQSIEAAKQKGTPFWMLIHKRDKREPVVYCSSDLIELLAEMGTHYGRPGLIARLDVAGETQSIALLPMSRFFQFTDREDIRTLHRQHKCSKKSSSKTSSGTKSKGSSSGRA